MGCDGADWIYEYLVQDKAQCLALLLLGFMKVGGIKIYY
jgi:hypothetical protein